MKLTKEEKANLEGAIQCALYKACIDQNRSLTGLIKQNLKRIFNRWTKEGENVLRNMEIVFDSKHLDLLDRYSDKIQDSVHELRKQIELEIIKERENEQA